MSKILEVDAVAAHDVIHSAKKNITLASGKTLSVTKNSSGCRSIKFEEGVQAVEQNVNKSSDWAEKAKKGRKITWFIGKGGPASWGRIVAGKVEARGNTIEDSASGGSSEALGASAKKRPAASSKDDAQVEDEKPPEKKQKTETEKAVQKSSATASCEPSSEKSTVAISSGPDPLGLSPLFSGSGFGATWEKILRPIIEGLPNASEFVGPGRDKRIVPVRELTFQALKPNPPSGWRVISFGQSPYPRIESATGIAHFDNALKEWGDSRFGSIVTMRCMIKAAAMYKYKVAKETTTQELRKLMESKATVGPAEWFQAMLTQGVLFMNAACTLEPPKEKADRSGPLVDKHRKFWEPAIKAVVKAILQDCQENERGVVFSWWGTESLKTRQKLKECFDAFPGVKVEHVDSKNPAAMADAFCDEPNVFRRINQALKTLKLEEIDWLPSEGWKAKLKSSVAAAEEMGDFIAETQDLHKMYLERLRDGLEISKEQLADITGISSEPLLALPEACKQLKLEKAATGSIAQAKAMKADGLTLDEIAAIHLYTTNYLYKLLNEALRDLTRAKVQQYFKYLRLLLSALEKLPKSEKPLYRGVALDLSPQYKEGAEVTWWAVSSCTPDLKVASSFSGGAKRSLFIIESMRSVGIREFSQYKNEEEFILAPGTDFLVTKVEKAASLTTIHLRELDRPRRVR